MRTDISIRPAELKDYESLCAIFARANIEHCAMRPDLYRQVDVAIPKFKYRLALLARDIFGQEPVSLQVAEHENRVVGAIFVQSLTRSKLSWSTFSKEAYLNNVAVLPEYRRQGVGTALLAAAQKWAKDTGHTHMWGKIINQNHPSMSFFTQANFSADSTNVGLHLSK